VAIEYGWTGFEWGESSEFSTVGLVRGAIVGITDLYPRTGQFMFSALNGDGNTNAFLSYRRKNQAIGNPVGSGNTAKTYTRVFFRIIVAPSLNDTGVLIAGGISASPGTWGGLSLNINRTFQCMTYGSPLGGVASTAVLSLGVWYRADLISTLTQTGGTGAVAATCSVYTEAGTLVETVTDSFSSVIVAGLPTDVQLANGTVQASAYHIDFDDWWMAWGDGADVAGMAFPTATRISRVPVLAQGASASWTGDFRTQWDVPVEQVKTDEQSSAATIGLQTTFTHAPVAGLGITGIEGAIVRARVKSALSNGNESLLLGGVAYTIPVTTTYFAIAQTCQSAVNYAAISDATFDGWEFGCRNDRGTSLQMCQCAVDVLHNGTGIGSPYADVAEPFRLNIITYTGNGTYKTVTGMGFPAQVLLFFSYGGSATSFGCWFSTRNGGTRAIALGSSQQETRNGVLAITPDGVLLGPNGNVNENALTFVLIGIRDGGAGGGFYMSTRTRVGQFIDNYDVVFKEPFAGALGWNQAAGGAGGSIIRTSAMTGDVAVTFSGGTSGVIANLIQAFTATGYQVGSNNAVAVNIFQSCILMRIAPALTGILHVGTMTPSGSTATITGIPFTPVWIAVQKEGSNGQCFWRSSLSHGTANSTGWAGGFLQANAVTSITADGATIGSALATAGTPVYWIALAGGALSAGGCLVDLATSAGGVGGAGCQVSLATG
jgi:hypothetical protein